MHNCTDHFFIMHSIHNYDMLYILGLYHEKSMECT